MCTHGLVLLRAASHPQHYQQLLPYRSKPLQLLSTTTSCISNSML